MSVDLPLPRPLGPVRPSCAQFDIRTLERHVFRDLGDVLAGVVHYGAPPWLAACRLTFVLRWLGDDPAEREADPIG